MDRSELAGTAPFDGIICLGGEDWWYHNRGHFDFQIMRRLARRWPVLFVNSLGVRMPKLNEKRVFVQRIARPGRGGARFLRLFAVQRARAENLGMVTWPADPAGGPARGHQAAAALGALPGRRGADRTTR